MVWNVVTSQHINAYRSSPLQENVRRVLHNFLSVENTPQKKNVVTGQKASVSNEFLTPAIALNIRRSLQPIPPAQSTSVTYNFTRAKTSESSRCSSSQGEQKRVESAKLGKCDIDGSPASYRDRRYEPLKSPSLVMTVMNMLKGIESGK